MSWSVMLAPSLTSLMPEEARSRLMQNAPSPVVWKNGRNCWKLPEPSRNWVKLLGFWTVATIPPTNHRP